VGSPSSSEPTPARAADASALQRRTEKRTRIWHGTTPSGYPLLIERDDRNRWVATIATASRSRNHSLVAAILEAAGTTIRRRWAEQLATTILTRTSSASTPRTRSRRTSDENEHMSG
jgi:hypothetical protein